MEFGALYEVTQAGGQLRLTNVGEYEDARTFDLTPPAWVLVVFGAPFGLGALVALGITVSFFWGYYVSGSRR